MAAPTTGTIPIPPGESSASPERITATDMRVIWVMLVAAFVAILNETAMGISIPKLVEDFDISTIVAQWVSSIFLLTMAVVIPITGFLIRRFTTRQMFLAAMTLFTLGTAIGAVSLSFEMLLVARVIQAMGTAVMMPLLMTTIMNLVPPTQRGRIMGRVSVVISLAPAMGPTLAGLVLDVLNWRWIFALMLPFALVSVFVGWRWLTNVGEQTHARIDILSVVLSAVGFGGVIYSLSEVGAFLAGDVPMWLLGVTVSVAVVALGAFGWRQIVLQRTDEALLDLRVFRSGAFSLALGQLALLSLAFFGSLTLIPLFLQDGLSLLPSQSGLVLLPGALAMGLLAPIVGRIYDSRGTLVLLVPGAVLAAAALWMFTLVTAETPVWVMIVLQVTLSAGLAFSFTPLLTASLGSLDRHFYAYGSAALNTTQQVAGAIGIALMLSLFTVTMNAAGGMGNPDAIAAGTRVAFIVAAVVASVSIIGAFLVRKPADSVDAPAAH